jgi:hypothetical protein
MENTPAREMFGPLLHMPSHRGPVSETFSENSFRVMHARMASRHELPGQIHPSAFAPSLSSVFPQHSIQAAAPERDSRRSHKS